MQQVEQLLVCRQSMRIVTLSHCHIHIVIINYHYDTRDTQLRAWPKSILLSLVIRLNFQGTWREKGHSGSLSWLEQMTSMPYSGSQGKSPDARQGKLFSVMASGVLAYPTDICVGCCVAVPGKFGKQLAVPKPHTAVHFSWICLMGDAIVSSSERIWLSSSHTCPS